MSTDSTCLTCPLPAWKRHISWCTIERARLDYPRITVTSAALLQDLTLSYTLSNIVISSWDKRQSVKNYWNDITPSTFPPTHFACGWIFVPRPPGSSSARGVYTGYIGLPWWWVSVTCGTWTDMRAWLWHTKYPDKPHSRFVIINDH